MLQKKIIYYLREKKEEIGMETLIECTKNHGKPFYCPLEYLDKRFVGEMYEQFDLMNNLFPITRARVLNMQIKQITFQNLQRMLVV